jgi:hypothetical protein
MLFLIIVWRRYINEKDEDLFNMNLFVQILFSLFTIFFTNIGAVDSISYCNETGSVKKKNLFCPIENNN